MNRLFVALIVLVGAFASGCSTVSGVLESRKVDYKSAGRLPPLEIPPDLTRPATDERFTVPDTTAGSGSATFSAYSRERGTKPATANPDILPNTAEARVERAGTQRWLVVKGAPDQLWPVVKDFWREIGFIVNLEVPEAGVMETEWAENRARIPDSGLRNVFGKFLNSISSTSERDKFRTRLERGGQSDSTEIFISHRGMVEVVESSASDRLIWQPRPADPELEAEMLRRLMVRFGVQEARAKADLSRDTVENRARMTKSPDGSGRLAVNDQFDRAWRRVGLALDRVGFTVEDRDRSKGLYFVRYVDPDADSASKQGGLLSKLAFWRGSGDAKGRNEQYRILVKDVDSTTEVNVLDKEGKVDRSPTANRILSLLFEQLR
jgi:outer membrane protein assembly factor BamC